jgi:hypothetical protein
MVGDWDGDVVEVKAWAFRDDASRPMPERTWDVSLRCVTGGLRMEVTALHLSDLLADSGILEPGDLAYRRFEGGLAGPPRGFRSWRRIELVDWDLERQEDGAALLVVNPAGRRPWRLRLTGLTWRQLCGFAVAAVGHPWFEALRAP